MLNSIKRSFNKFFSADSHLSERIALKNPGKRDFESALYNYLRNAVMVRLIDNSWLYYAFDDTNEIIKDLRYFIEEKQKTFEEILICKGDAIKREIETKSYLYNLLFDRRSQELLVIVAAYQILGHRHVRFPYFADKNIQLRKSLETLCNNSRNADSSLLSQIKAESIVDYALFDLVPIGLHMMIYSSAEMLFRIKTESQYVCPSANGSIGVSRGDIILDCGGALGDTALHFAAIVGDTGRVFSMEPNPICIEAFNANLALNKHIRERIQLIQSATWNNDNDVLRFAQSGPGSRVDESGKINVKTMTIDTLVANAKLKKVDFIKMDIEGAELNAIQGAVKTITKHKPKLAICLYHKPDDFDTIPRYLNDLDLGYEFYLEHHYVNEWETVLYAKS